MPVCLELLNLQLTHIPSRVGSANWRRAMGAAAMLALVAVSNIAPSQNGRNFTLLDALGVQEREPFLCDARLPSRLGLRGLGAMEVNNNNTDYISESKSYIAWRRTLHKLIHCVASDGFVVFNVVNRLYADWIPLWTWQWKELLPARNYFVTSLDEQATAECRRRGVAHISLPDSGVYVRSGKLQPNEPKQTCVFQDVWYRVGIAKIAVLAEIVCSCNQTPLLLPLWFATLSPHVHAHHKSARGSAQSSASQTSSGKLPVLPHC
eukprot:2463511-Prymnesium_polylepis.1